ncbi:ATP-grasp domain-containing protein [Myceligenerans salitolerans]|uniref:ATP-grasp domain-containing protein n=1 Tax=Myceligenerans salitolerans TaxID=1230528 RepID=A0ABS3I7H4_9MICO|nr:ATP-grasp domain-containing protein [Myceligenerans salitolerans]MBO0608903.1 ATP-grasp domain-containing protein [Myceligenerans salitolerans]
MALPLLLVPSDPLAPRVPDPHFAREADAARQAGMDVAVVDHDAIIAGDIRAAVRRVPTSNVGRTAWYRGWMIHTPTYALLATGLQTRGARLLTDPTMYQAAHELPGWYDAFADLTPTSIWSPWEANRTPKHADVAAWACKLGGGPALVKDYVKSRKHEWHEACFIPDLADAPAATRVIATMIKLQDADLNGGIVVRRFEPFLPDDAGRTREARAWWVEGSLALITPHPDAPAGTTVNVPAAILDAVRSGVHALGSPFVTTDLAQRSDGVWRVIEVGDGQVSDLPATQDPAPLTQALSAGPPTTRHESRS